MSFLWPLLVHEMSTAQIIERFLSLFEAERTAWDQEWQWVSAEGPDQEEVPQLRLDGEMSRAGPRCHGRRTTAKLPFRQAEESPHRKP